MGLLTDPNTGQGKYTKMLINNGGRLCILIYVCGILWFLCLSHKSFNNGTYFSENALLPGLVRGEFDEDVAAKKYHSELNQVMQSNPNVVPYQWLQKQFSDMNIDSYLHNFTLDYPLAHNTQYRGQNLYAILRASRSSSIEGIVVTAPFRTLDSAHPDNTASIALMLSLAKFCRQQKYWAKDIVFLITDHEQLGTQAWLEAYHGIRLGSGILNHGNVVGRVGSIQAAINLEFHSTKISHVDVKVEGLNGQLPNLDLVNLVHRLCSKEGIRHTFKNRTNPRKKDGGFQQWFHSFTTLLSMVLTQASCVPNGNHGLYHRFGIEAVTLEGHEPPPNFRQQVAGTYQAGRVLEGILRSLNNLLERFHQSYFFYLLPGNDRYISIGLYMPAVGLIGAPLLIKALSIWLEMYNYIKPKKYEKSEGGNGSESIEKPAGTNKDFKISLTRIGTIFLVCHIFGWLFVQTGPWLSKIGAESAGFVAKDSIYVGYFIYFFLSIKILNAISLTRAESNFLNIMALLELATLLLTIAMHNFSLALILGIIYVPCVIFINGESGRMKKILLTSSLLLVHPYVLVHLAVLVYTYLTLGDADLVAKAFTATRHSFVYFIVDNMIYGNWFIEAVFGFLIPNWVLFWILVRSEPKLRLDIS